MPLKALFLVAYTVFYPKINDINETYKLCLGHSVLQTHFDVCLIELILYVKQEKRKYM